MIDQTPIMIPFKPISDHEPALAHSPVLRAVLLTFEFIESNGPIELTKGKALKRYFVEWAAEQFAWPNFTAEDLYAVNKVLNEQDFPPLVMVHDLLLSTKVARHYKGALRMTSFGKDMRSKPGELWRLLADHLLFVLDQSRYTWFEDVFMTDFTYLDIIDVEGEVGVTEARLCSLLYGGEESQFRGVDYAYALALYALILRPLSWAGLLSEQYQGLGWKRDRVFVKTPLWAAALDLDHAERDSAHTRH